MNDAEVRLVMSLCRNRGGLHVAPEKTYLIESRLGPVARREGYPSITALLAAIRATRQEGLIWAVVEAMTSPETSFFRDKAVFEHIESVIYPALVRARGGRPVRFWSAAASTGQEVYSLAMVFDRLHRQGAAPPADLAASDLSAPALERARLGLYSQSEVQRGLPIRLLVKHFEKKDDLWRLSPAIRRLVRWRRINLIADLSSVGEFDVVLCRNVLCDLHPSFQTAVMGDLARVVAPDGYLIVGGRDDPASVAEYFDPADGVAGVFRPSQSRAVAA